MLDVEDTPAWLKRLVLRFAVLVGSPMQAASAAARGSSARQPCQDTDHVPSPVSGPRDELSGAPNLARREPASGPMLEPTPAPLEGRAKADTVNEWLPAAMQPRRVKPKRKQKRSRREGQSGGDDAGAGGGQRGISPAEGSLGRYTAGGHAAACVGAGLDGEAEQPPAARRSGGGGAHGGGGSDGGGAPVREHEGVGLGSNDAEQPAAAQRSSSGGNGNGDGANTSGAPVPGPPGVDRLSGGKPVHAARGVGDSAGILMVFP